MRWPTWGRQWATAALATTLLLLGGCVALPAAPAPEPTPTVVAPPLLAAEPSATAGRELSSRGGTRVEPTLTPPPTTTATVPPPTATAAPPTPTAEPSTATALPPTATAALATATALPPTSTVRPPTLTSTPPRPAPPPPPPTRTVAPAPAPAPAAGDFSAAAEATGLALVNAERQAAGLPPVVMYEPLRQVARAHAADMAARNYFAHNTPEGLTPFDRLRRAGMTFGKAGENLGFSSGILDPVEAVRVQHQTMMAEVPPNDGHRRTVLNNAWRKVGIGVVLTPDGRVYFACDFTD